MAGFRLSAVTGGTTPLRPVRLLEMRNARGKSRRNGGPARPTRPVGANGDAPHARMGRLAAEGFRPCGVPTGRRRLFFPPAADCAGGLWHGPRTDSTSARHLFAAAVREDAKQGGGSNAPGPAAQNAFPTSACKSGEKIDVLSRHQPTINVFQRDFHSAIEFPGKRNQLVPTAKTTNGFHGCRKALQRATSPHSSTRPPICDAAHALPNETTFADYFRVPAPQEPSPLHFPVVHRAERLGRGPAARNFFGRALRRALQAARSVQPFASIPAAIRVRTPGPRRG